MNISAASKAAGLPVKTVRYYADIGLVEAPSRSGAGYRTYDDVTASWCSSDDHVRSGSVSKDAANCLASIKIKTAPVRK
jgi:DNA-binding transcriptional MerR regulator